MSKKIMIVEDSLSIREDLEAFLVREGYDVKSVSCGEEAIEVFDRFMPDLILLDLVMPGIDGYEVCRIIRENEVSGFTKVIMLSRKTDLEKRLEGYVAGVDDYICKPFNKEELLAKIEVFMRLKAVEDQLRELNETLNSQVEMRTRQLLDAEKMAAIGRHTAGIIHNLNNPLCAIMATSQFLALKYPEDRHIMLQRKAAGQMTRIIKTILNTGSKENREEIALLDMNEILRSQVEIMRSNLFFKNQVKTQLKFEPLPPFRGVYAHFSQIYANLIKNAVDAMYESPKRTLTIYSRVENNQIIIRIEDTGYGIARQHIDKIFNPFFTTKPLMTEDGRPTGTGLGLASCKEMIESYNGKLIVDSVHGKGTGIIVQLPLNTGALAGDTQTV